MFLNGFEKRLDAWVSKYLEIYPFSGILRITQKDEILYERCEGLADREWGIGIDRSTRFRFYSLTKPFCAIGILRLVDEGRLELDAHPGKYLKGAEKLHPAVTIRSLLNHSSGLPDFRQWRSFRDLAFRYPVDKQMLLGEMCGLPMNFEPGSSVYYGNFNYYLASRIIEESSGKEFAEYMQTRVFEAMDMENACIDGSEKIITKKARGYDINRYAIVKAPYLNIDWMMGAGSGVGTVDDVYQLNKAIKKKTILSESSWKAILTPTKEGMGLGCSVAKWRGKIRYTHNGAHCGFRTLHIQIPEDDLDIILLSNMGFGNARGTFSEAILNMLYGNDTNADRTEMDKGFARQSEIVMDILYPERPSEIQVDGSQYSGYYQTETSDARVFVEGNKGEILLNGWQHMPVYCIGNGVFQHAIIDENYRFVKGTDGKMKFGEMVRE